MKKRVFSIILCLCMIFSLLPAVASAASTGDFSDFPQASHWAYSALEAAVKNGLMTGDSGRLNPTANMSRAEMATVINRAFGATAKADISALTDVSKTKWYYEDIAKAVAMGTFEGDGGGTMRPEEPITRQEAFVVLARALSLSGSSSGLNKFTDRGSVASWAAEALGAMAAAGYVQGDGGLLSPLAKISRQEFAQVMLNMFKTYVGASASVSSLPTGNVIINGSGAVLKNLTVNGDLIIADGVGSGGVTLDGVTVTGRIVVRGGGSSALTLTGSTVKGAVIMAAKGAGLAADKGSALGQIQVKANNVTITAQSGTVAVGAGVTGAKVNGKDLAGGQSTEIGASSTGGGTPPVATVPTSSLIIKGTTMTVGKGQEALAVSRNSGANDALKWESSNPAVVRVDATTGRLSALSEGTVTVSAESQSGVVGSATVYVVKPNSAADLADYTITEPGTVLQNCSFTKLTIDESVGIGDVTLINVTAGTLVVKGGGQNTVELSGGSYNNLEVAGTSSEGTRILVSEGVYLPKLNIKPPEKYQLMLETKTGSSASIGTVENSGDMEIRNCRLESVTTQGNLKITNSEVDSVTTSVGSPTLTLNNSTVDALTAQATSTTITGNSGVTAITASGNVTTGAGTPVGTIAASGNANVTANGAVGSVTGSTTGNVSLTNSGNTAVSANAASVSVSGESKPTVSGTVNTVNVAADLNGSSGVTVIGGTTAINATGTGKVGEISIGGSATPTVNTATAIALISVTGDAEATVTGSHANVVNTSTGRVTNNTASVTKVTPTLQHISVTSLPTKTEYKEGETLETAGLVVTGYYTVPGFDGTISKAIALNTGGVTDGYELSGFSADTAGEKTIIVRYGGKTTSFKVNVVAKTVASISIKTVPTAKTYNIVNGTPDFSATGGKITVNYTSSLYRAETKTIESDWCSITSETDLSTTGAKTVTVTYEGKTTSFTVNVIDSAADALALAKTKAKAEFLNYVADKLIENTYSETGKAAIKSAKEAGLTNIDGATKDNVASVLVAAKAAVNEIPTQDGEWAAEADSFKADHDDVLKKTAANIAIGDKADVSLALAAYGKLGAAVQAKLTTQKTLLDSLLAKIATIEAGQELKDAQDAAKETLKSALAKYNSGYTTNISRITKAKTDGDTAITKATTVAEVTDALNNALAAMANFKSDAQILTDAKTTAINKLNAYLPRGMTQAAFNTDYNATGKAQIAEARSAGVADINAAETPEAVNTELEAAEGNIDAIQTAAEMATAALNAAKTAAIKELTNYGDESLYRTAQKAEFNTAKTAGAAAINADTITTTAAVTDALKEAKKKIDKIKTDEELDIQETALLTNAMGRTETISFAPQTNSPDLAEENLKARVKAIIDGTIGDTKIIVSIINEGYTAATDGTAENRNGTAGSFSFTVSLTTGETSMLSRSLTLLITPVYFGTLSVNGVGYTDLQTALNAEAAATNSVEIVGDYTIASGTKITVEQGHKIIVKSGASLTNNGTIKYHKSTMAQAMSDSGQLIIQRGGSYTVGGTKLVGDGTAVFNLLEQVMDTEDNTKVAIEQGEVWILGAPNDNPEEIENYLRPFLFLNGNIELPEGKSYTVSGSDYMVFAANGDLSVKGTLTSTAFNEVRGGVTVENGGSLTLNCAEQSRPVYFTGDENVPHSMGGSVFVKFGGSYTVGTTKLIGTAGAALTMTQGDAMICGQPADGGENPFVFVFGGAKATAGEYDWQSYHFIVDKYTDDNSETHTGELNIPLGVTVTLGSNEIRGSVTNSGTLTATNGLGVDGSITNSGTIDLQSGTVVGGSVTNSGTITNHDMIHLLPGASMTNNSSGIINGIKNNNNTDDLNDDWWQTRVIVEFSAKSGVASAILTNSGRIYDSVTICNYLGSNESGDKLTTVTNSGSGTIENTYRVAYVSTTAALKRAIAATNPAYDEYHPIGNFVLDENVEIPNGHLLYAPAQWYNGTDSPSDCRFTVAENVTLANYGGVEFWGGTTVNGTIVNNEGENTRMVVGTQGTPGKTFTIASGGTVTNNGYLQLMGEGPAKGDFTIASGGTLTNVNYMEMYGYLLTNSGTLNNSGTIDTEFGYDQSGNIEVGITGTALTGNGVVNGTAFVSNGAGLSAAAGDTKVNSIFLSSDTGAVAVTLANDVTIRDGVTLRVTQDYNEETITSYELVVPNDKTLTVDGELILKGKLTVQQGGTVNGSGKLIKYDSAVITKNGTLSLTSPAEFVTTEAALKAALSDTTVKSITIDKSITLADNLDLTKPVTIAEGWDGDLPRVILIVPSGKSLTISANMDVKGGLVGEGGSITIAAGKTVTVTGRMGYISSDAASATLTVNGTLELRDGAGLVLGNHYQGDHATAAGSVTGNGTIEVINGWIDFVNSNEQTVVNGCTVNYYANRADLARQLVERLAGYPNTVELVGDDYNSYGNTYSDWGELYNDTQNPDNDAAHGLAWLLKNGIITGSNGRIYPYGELPAAIAKEIFTNLASKILGGSYTGNTEMQNFLTGLSGDGYISRNEVTGGNYNTNALNQTIDGFIAALNLSTENVINETQLTAALKKSYVTDIHITQSMIILGAKDKDTDTNNSYYLSPAPNAERRIYIDPNVTLTVGDDSTSTKLDIQPGVELIIEKPTTGTAGQLTIKSGSGMNVFGGLRPDNWGSLVTQENNTYINFFPDVMEFGKRLKETVGERLTAASVTDETKNAAQNWPSDDNVDRIAGFEFLVAYGNLSYKTEGNNNYWTPYEKVSYSEAMDMLLSTYNAIVDPDVQELPTSVTLNGYQSDYLVSDNDLNELLRLFAAVLPKLNDTTASFTVSSTPQTFSNKNFTQPVTISYGGSATTELGGEIRFENCNFEKGVTINYSDSARFAVDFSDSCTVTTGGVTVAPGTVTNHDLWKNNNVELWGAKGLTITAEAPTQAHCGSGQSFTLNGVSVTGTITGDAENEKWFDAVICYVCNGDHREWTDDTWQAGNHGGCTMPDGTGTTSSTTSPEFHLNTGTAGSITATGEKIAYNVRVEGNANISRLSVADGKEIVLSDNQRASDVNIGANIVQVYDNANHGYTFTATTGTAHIHNQNVTNCSSVTLNGKDLGTPHVFGDSTSGYQIFVGIASADGLTFGVEENRSNVWTALTEPKVEAVGSDGQSSTTPIKLHLSKSDDTDATWFTNPTQVRLTVTVTGGGKVVYEPLADHTTTQP